MTLQLGGISNVLFEHSQEFSQGAGEVRKGQDATIVAKDGSGDFDDIQEAMDSVEDGAKIFIKNGRYKATDLEFTSNVTIEGESLNVVLELDNTTNNNKYIDMKNLSKILIKNITMELKGNYNDSGWSSNDFFYHIDISESSEIELEKIKLISYTEVTSGEDGYIGVIFTDTTSKLKMINCEVYEDVSGSIQAVFYNTVLSECTFKRNKIGEEGDINLIGTIDDQSVEDIIVTNNRFGGILLLQGNLNNSIIEGNICDEGIQISSDKKSEKNIISSNHFKGVGISLGDNTQYNAVVRNVTKDATQDDGTDNVVASGVEY